MPARPRPRDKSGALPDPSAAGVSHAPHGGTPPAKPLENFLNPQSMMTPGICGVMTVAITNSLTLKFDVPEAWVGLGVSAVFSALVVREPRLFERVGYIVANTLIIFSVAFGVATTPGAVAQATKKASAFLFVGSAFAQTSDDSSRLGGAAASLANECAMLSTTNRPPEIDRFCKEFLNSYSASPELKAVSPNQPNIDRRIANDAPALKLENRNFFSPWRF